MDLITFPNYHNAKCGTPPPWPVGQSGIYHGYFRSASGDQWVFEYRAQTQEGRLWGGDCQWEEPYPVQEGTCVQLIMAADERAWLQACWQAALSHFPPKA